MSSARFPTGWVARVGCLLVLPMLIVGCPSAPPPPENPCEINPVNCLVGVDYLGSSTCRACHPGIADLHDRHGHAHALKPTQGVAPDYSPLSRLTGVPEPPPGFDWTDIAYVTDGFNKVASFVDLQGYLLTDGATGRAIRYNLANPAAGTEAGYVPFSIDQVQRTRLDFWRFSQRATGAIARADAGGRQHENRPGIDGIWAGPGAGCEACHGPGGDHVPNPSAGNIEIGNSQATCSRCHSDPALGNAIAAQDGFILPLQQHAELQASPHPSFACTYCHDPHASTVNEPARGIRNACSTCHSGRNMALHEGFVYRRGDYTETLTCQSCHMPLAGREGGSALAGNGGRIGDTRVHFMYINTGNVDYRAFLTADGTQVARGSDGKAAVTVDFVCLRCHNGAGNAFTLSLESAASIAVGVHRPY